MKLVIARHLLHRRAAAVLEHDEVSDKRQEPARLEDAFQHHLQLGYKRVGQRFAGHGAPGLEPLSAGGERADAGLDPIRNHQRFVHGEEGGQLGLIGLKLLPCRPDGGVLIGGILELDDAQGQAVDEQHHVRPAGVPVFGDGELVDGEEVVISGVIEVNGTDNVAAHPSPVFAILDLHAVHEHAVKVAVAGFQRCAFRPRQHAVGIVQRIDWQPWVELGQSVPQPPLQHHLPVVPTLGMGRAGGDVRPVGHGPAEAGEPVKGRLFDIGFS